MRRICYLPVIGESPESALSKNCLIVDNGPPKVDYLKLEIRVLEYNTDFGKRCGKPKKTFWGTVKKILRREDE